MNYELLVAIVITLYPLGLVTTVMLHTEPGEQPTIQSFSKAIWWPIVFIIYLVHSFIYVVTGDDGWVK